MNKWHILVICGAAIASTLVVYSNTSYISDKSILGFLMMSPTLIGILLASVLTSLAIILAIIGSSEMIKIKELEDKQSEEFYRKISNNLKQNVHFILISFIISTLLSVFYIEDSYFTISFDYVISFEIYKSLFVLVVILFVISCIATYDIINGLFAIFEFKYDLSSQKN